MQRASMRWRAGQGWARMIGREDAFRVGQSECMARTAEDTGCRMVVCGLASDGSLGRDR